MFSYFGLSHALSLSTLFANVPADKWCTCEPKVEVDGKSYPPQAKMSLGIPTFIKNLVGGGSKTEEKKGEL